MFAMRAFLPVLAFAGLAGCAASATGPREGDALASELAGLEAGEPATCIDQSPATNLQVIDQRTLVYRTSRRIWVNRLEAACPGLRPLNLLVIQSDSGRYCRGDTFRSLDGASNIPGPICRLNDFIPYHRR